MSTPALFSCARRVGIQGLPFLRGEIEGKMGVRIFEGVIGERGC